MSIRLMSLIFEKETNTSGSKRLVLLAIADNANDEGVCWPAITTIARKANISRTYAKQLVHELRDDGYIQITRRPRKDNRDETNLYRIIPLWVGEAGLPLPGVGMPQLPQEGDPWLPQEGEAGIPQRGSPASPESSLEPSIKSSSEEKEDDNSLGRVIKAYNNNIGLISSEIVKGKIIEAFDRYGEEWMMKAIEAGALHHAKNWAYIDKVLQGYERNGFNSNRIIDDGYTE